MRAQPPDETKQPEQNADPNIEAERIKRRDLETKQDIIAETRPGRNETSYQGDLLPIMSMVLDDFASFGGRVGPLLRAIGPPICPNLLFAVFYSNPLKLGLADKLGCF